MIGERTNVTGSRRFARLIKSGDYEGALHVARDQIEGGANILDVNMDEGLLDAEQAMTRFLNMLGAEPDIARLPIMIDSSKWSVIEAGLRCVQGKAVVNSISLKEGEASFVEQARLVRAYGAAVIVMAFDEQGQADTVERKVGICKRSYEILTRDVGFDPAALVTQLRIGCSTRLLVYIGHCQVLQKITGLASADFKFGERRHIDQDDRLASRQMLATDSNLLLRPVESQDILLRDITVGKPVGPLPAEL